jgi:glutamate formiminotransferase
MIVECIPNVSEGRRLDVVARMADALAAIPGVRLLDFSSDGSHNRSVFTLAGEAGGLQQAAVTLVGLAVAHVDLRTHRGEHPRIGAVDVIPFVPIADVTMDDCVRLAKTTAAEIADRHHVPVFLYEEASARPGRRKLEDIRRGGFEGLAAKMRTPGWEPDFGPAAPHPTAGATVVGARAPLIAYNVNLATDRLDVARAIAAKVRQSGGGLPFVKAMGVRLGDRGIVQVSMNLTDYTKTPIDRAFDAVTREARALGVSVLESEIVGLVPAAALRPGDRSRLRLERFADDQVLEARLARDA